MPVNHFLPLVGNESVGQRTMYGTWLPPGARLAAYVGPQSSLTDSYSTNGLLVSTLAAGLARCRAGKGDVVVVLPGHTETVSTTTMLDNLVSGTQILGAAPFGSTLMPTFTFSGTTNTSTWTVDDADVTMAGLKLACSGADSIDTPLVVTGASFSFINNYVDTGTGASNDCDVAITVGTGATNCTIAGNVMITTGGANTNIILVSGTGVNGLRILDNFIHGSCSSNALINLTGTAVGFQIGRNILHNVGATAPTGIAHADTALVGIIHDNRLAFTTDITVLTGAISAAGVATASVRSINNFGCDEDSLGGVLTPTATNLE